MSYEYGIGRPPDSSQRLPVTLPALRHIPDSVDPALRKVLESIIGLINTREGITSTSLLDMNITRRDLESLGIDSSVIDNPNIIYQFAGSGPISAPGNIPDPVDNDAPGPITDLEIVRRTISNRLLWVNPPDTDEDISHVEIWHSHQNDLATAVLIGIATFPTAQFIHSALTYGTTSYYWLRVMDSSGNGSEFVQGIASISISDSINELLDQLMGTGTDYQEEFAVVANSFSITLPSSAIPAWSDKNWLEGDIVHHVGGETYNYYYSVADITAPAAAPQINADWINFDVSVLPTSKKVLRLGLVDGIPTLGLRADMVVDGGILAKHIAADQIDGTHIQAASQISLATGGQLFLDTAAILRIGGAQGGQAHPGLYYDGAGNFYANGSFTFTSAPDIRSQLNVADGATNTTNTNQLTDGAGLGNTATWNGVGDKPAFAPADADKTGDNNARGLDRPDTRSVNSPPSYYYGLGRGTYSEFKTRTTIGAPGVGTYVSLTTEVPWAESSGGPVIQTCSDGDNIQRRKSTSASAWGSWQTIADGADSTQTRINGGVVTTGSLQAANASNVVGAGVAGGGSASTDIRLWAGNTFANRGSAPFRVTHAGNVHASNIYARGDVQASSLQANVAMVATANIGNLAVTNAKIGGAAITTAKIGDAQVNTLQVAGNAITFMGSGFAMVGVGFGPGTHTIITASPITISTISGRAVVLNASFHMFLAGETGTYNIQVMRNATELTAFSQSFDTNSTGTHTGPLVFSLVDSSPPSGSTTYSIRVSNGLAGSVSSFSKRFITVLEVKR